MTRIRAISTFNKDGLEIYGKDLMASWALMPDSVPLTVYQEGFNLTDGIDLSSIAWLTEFKARHAARSPSSFHYDAVRFAHKTAAVIHAVETGQQDFLMWIDGDTYVHSKLKESDIENLLPNSDSIISWLWRDFRYPECGLYFINCKHDRAAELVSNWKYLYTSDDLFSLPEWHDSYVLAHLIKEMALPWESLSGSFESSPHPFVNGPLGTFFDHRKGDRKFEVTSSVSDLEFFRNENYWKQQYKVADYVRIFFRILKRYFAKAWRIRF